MKRELKHFNKISELPRIIDTLYIKRSSGMHIKMKSTEMGVNDGDIQCTEYESGKTYDVGPELGTAFVNADMATNVTKKVSKEEAAAKEAEAKEAEAKEVAEKEEADRIAKEAAENNAKVTAEAEAKQKAEAEAKDAGNSPENKDKAGAPENK
jgi:hypothetical protein